MDTLLTEILKTVKPSKEEESDFIRITNNVLKRINSNLKDAKVILGGSGAKVTWLKGFHDVDLFVLFDYNKFKEKHLLISDILEKSLKRKFKAVKRIPGSRDYFQINEKGYTFEIIPILEIKKADEALNITDISPLHVDWVKKNKRYCDEIRLTKRFCRAQDVYGAESYIKGFSGYLLEILTIYYKSFSQLLKNTVKWKEKMVIDIGKYYKNPKEAIEYLNKAKTYSPIIVIDPVQKERNVAAALSREKFLQFKEASRKFLKRQNKDFFTKKPLDIEKLKKKAGNNILILLEAKASGSKEDIIGCKLMKVFDYISKQIVRKDFKIVNEGWEFDRKNKAVYWFMVDNKKLSELKKVIGPPVKSKYHSKRFKEKHKKTFIEKNRICTNIKRKFREPFSLVKALIKEDYTKEKIRIIKLIKT